MRKGWIDTDNFTHRLWVGETDDATNIETKLLKNKMGYEKVRNGKGWVFRFNYNTYFDVFFYSSGGYTLRIVDYTAKKPIQAFIEQV